jgi:hypothetical protein
MADQFPASSVGQLRPGFWQRLTTANQQLKQNPIMQDYMRKLSGSMVGSIVPPNLPTLLSAQRMKLMELGNNIGQDIYKVSQRAFGKEFGDLSLEELQHLENGLVGNFSGPPPRTYIPPEF